MEKKCQTRQLSQGFTFVVFSATECFLHFWWLILSGGSINTPATAEFWTLFLQQISTAFSLVVVLHLRGIFQVFKPRSFSHMCYTLIVDLSNLISFSSSVNQMVSSFAFNAKLCSLFRWEYYLLYFPARCSHRLLSQSTWKRLYRWSLFFKAYA